MTKHNALFSGYIVHAVVFCVSGCFCFGVDTPFLGEQAPVYQISAEQNDDCNQNDDNAIYNYSSLISLSKHYSRTVKTKIQLTKRTNFWFFIRQFSFKSEFAFTFMLFYIKNSPCKSTNCFSKYNIL